MPRKELDFNKVYHSNMCGDFILVEEYDPVKINNYNNSTKRQIKIRFLDTGYETITDANSILKGSVKDPYAKIISGVACIGIPKILYNKREYDSWFHMIKRCYQPGSNSYERYGALGVKVCERWHCFEYFIEDFYKLPGIEEYLNAPDNEKCNYHLDKDLRALKLGLDNKIYSPDTCTILNIHTNARLQDKNRTSSKYRGLYKVKDGSWQLRIRMGGKTYFIGIFNDEIAGANMYNHLVQIINDEITVHNIVPYMDVIECLKHRTSITPLKLPDYIIEKLGISRYELNKYSMVNTSSRYIGVRFDGKYYPSTYVNTDGCRCHIGTFTDERAAAVMHDAFTKYMNGSPNSKINNISNMTIGQAISYSRKNLDTMCSIVDNSIIDIGKVISDYNTTVAAYTFSQFGYCSNF